MTTQSTSAQREERRARVPDTDPGLAVAPGASDATFLIHDAGIPSLTEIEPSGGRSHDVNEFVDIGDVIDGARILVLPAIERLGIERR